MVLSRGIVLRMLNEMFSQVKKYFTDDYSASESKSAFNILSSASKYQVLCHRPY